MLKSLSDVFRLIKWSTCALSEQPLKSPIVADRFGNVFNKEAVLRFLLNRKGIFENEEERHAFSNLKRTQGSRLDHIRKKKDVFELNIGDWDSNEEPLKCPVSNLDCLRCDRNDREGFRQCV